MMDPTSGKMEAVVEYVYDITEKKQAELALTKSQEEYRLLVNQIPAVVFKGYADWSVDFFDDKIESFTGYRKEDFDSRRVKWRDLVLPEDLDAVRRAFAEDLTTGKSYVREYRIRKKDGEIIWIQARGQVFCDAQGKVDCISGLFFDITSQKRAQEALEQAKKEWEEIFQAIGHPTIILGPDYSIQGANRATLDTLGMSGAEILHKKCYEIFHHKTDRPPAGCPLEKMHLSGHWETVEMEMEALDGVFMVSCTPIFDCQGGLKKIFHIATDITSCKHAEAELQKYRGHLESLVQERTAQLTRANEQLQREIFEHQRTAEKLQTSLEEKEVLLREIHHRVKNNLQLISSLLSLQATYQGEKDPREVFAESENRIRSLTLIHESLYQSKDFSRIEFTGYLRELLVRLLQVYKFPGQSITGAVEGNEIYLDITQAIPCGLIVNELVSNSLKHAFPEGREGEIQVTMKRVDGRKVLSVKDNGVGLPPSVDLQDKGMLGLQIVTTLVNQLGGEMNYTANGGAEFTLTF